MKIRRYIGKDAQEAILKVKMDLGSDAIILSTRKIRQRGFLKIFSKPMIEVLAAIDEYSNSSKKETAKNNNKNIQANANEQAAVSMPIAVAENKGEKISELENKVNSMEELLKKVYDQLQSSSGLSSKQNSLTHSNFNQSTEMNISKVSQLFLNNLIKSEVNPEFAKQIIDNVNERTKGSSSVNDVASVLYNIIAGSLGKPETLKLREDGNPTIVIFVGPTGVGKTTTLAKIAANYSLNNKKNVGLITADTYRIAAVEQLKTYADILGMPVEIIYSANEVKSAIEGYSDKDVIFIDTAGRSYKDREQFNELEALIENAHPDEIYLVLSSTTSTRSCSDIINNYSFLKDYKLIFTKLDESSVSGVILNVKNITEKSLSYVTTGQSVPDDIEVANIDKITKNLLGSIA